MFDTLRELRDLPQFLQPYPTGVKLYFWIWILGALVLAILLMFTRRVATDSSRAHSPDFYQALLLERDRPAKRVEEWPPDLKPGGTYEVLGDEHDMYIDHLVIPEDATIVAKVELEWAIRKLTFGRRATLDLSGAREKPGHSDITRYIAGSPTKYQRDGFQGGIGFPGESGHSLEMYVCDVEPTGSLWIRTDGGPGADGGPGEDGRPHETNSKEHLNRPGGRGGDGGVGGNGGDTSRVQFKIFEGGSWRVLPVHGNNQGTSPSTRPSNASGDRGTIVIWGAPGPPGQGGPPGQPGTNEIGTGAQGVRGREENEVE